MVIPFASRRTPGVLAALLCFVLGQLLFALTPLAGGVRLVLPGIGLHLLGIVIGLRGLRQHKEAVQAPAWTPSRRTEIACVTALVVVAAVLRFAWLDTLPGLVDGDAAAFAIGATGFLRADRPPLIGTGWQAHTNLYFFLVSRMIRLFGRSVWAIRVLSATGGTLGVPAIYLLGRTLWNVRVGLAAAFVMSVLPFHLVFSRVGTEVVQLTWLLPLVITLIYLGWQQQAWYWLLLGGMVAGLSQYFYPGARLIPILCFVQIALLVLFPPDATPETTREWRRGLRALQLVVLGFLVVYAPMIAHYAQYPDAYTARIKLVSITDGWLQEQLASRPWWSVIGEQVWRAALPFHYPVGGAPLWYLWPQYLQPIDAALLSLGLLGIWSETGTPRWLRFYLLAYLSLAIFLGGVMTIESPMPSRYMILIPGVVLAIGYALVTLVQHVESPRSRYREVVEGVVIGALLFYGATNIRAYLRHDTNDIWNGDLTGQIATVAAQHLQTLPQQNYNLLFLQTGYQYFGASPALPFLTNKTGTNIEESFSCAVLYPYLQAGPTVVIAPWERAEELRQNQPRITPSKLVTLQNPKGEDIVAVLEIGFVGEGAARCDGP